MNYVILEKAHVKGFLRTRRGKLERVKEHERRIPNSEELAVQNIPTRDVLGSLCTPTRAGESSTKEYKYNSKMLDYCKRLRSKIENNLLSTGHKKKDVDSMYHLIKIWNSGYSDVQSKMTRRIFSRLGEVVDGNIKLDNLIDEERGREFNKVKNNMMEDLKWQLKTAYPGERKQIKNKKLKQISENDKELKKMSENIKKQIPGSVVSIFKELRTISRVLYNKLYDGKGVMYRGISDSVDNRSYAKDLVEHINKLSWSKDVPKLELETRGGVSFTPHKNVGKFFAQYNSIKDGYGAVIGKRILPEQIEMFWPVLNGELNNTVDTREVIVRFPGNKIPLTKDEVVW